MSTLALANRSNIAAAREVYPLAGALARCLALGLKALLLCLAVGLTAAEVRFFLAHPVSETRFARTRPDPPARFNLADPALGVTVRASSALWSKRHHPGYVVSGHLGTTLEKWASSPDDPAPWIEVEFDRPRHTRSVELTLAGALESADLTMRDYALACFDGDRQVNVADVRGNRSDRPQVDLACAHATRVRVTFPREASGPRDVARVYGLAVWGSS